MRKLRTCSSCGYRGYKFHPSVGTRCRKCLAAAQREYRKTRCAGYWKNKDKKYTLKKKYGLSIEEFERMNAAQDGRCLICKKRPEEMPPGRMQKNVLYVDHDHKTGKVRGLLCNGCNRALGFVQDDPVVAREMAVYLESRR